MAGSNEEHEARAAFYVSVIIQYLALFVIHMSSVTILKSTGHWQDRDGLTKGACLPQVTCYFVLRVCHANLLCFFNHGISSINLPNLHQAIEQMIEDAKAAGLPPVMAAYTSLIKAYGANHSLTDVRRVLVEMKEDGVAPNQLHYRTAMIAHGHAGRPLEGQVTVCKM